MMVLITYDVSTETEAGKGRLRKVAKKVPGLRPTRAEFGV